MKMSIDVRNNKMPGESKWKSINEWALRVLSFPFIKLGIDLSKG